MKRFLIKYTFGLEAGATEDWHRSVAAFIAALDADPALRGRVRYRCMKARGGADYYHVAEATDDDAVQALQQREFFKRYTEETKRVAGGGAVVVVPLETIAESPPS
jgi:hypothetical protein